MAPPQFNLPTGDHLRGHLLTGPMSKTNCSLFIGPSLTIKIRFIVSYHQKPYAYSAGKTWATMFSVYFRRVGYSELKSLLISLGFSRYRRVEKWEKTAQSTWNGDLIYGENATYGMELVSEEVLLVA